MKEGGVIVNAVAIIRYIIRKALLRAVIADSASVGAAAVAACWDHAGRRMMDEGDR